MPAPPGCIDDVVVCQLVIISPCSPLTARRFRKLLVDRVMLAAGSHREHLHGLGYGGKGISVLNGAVFLTFGHGVIL